MKRKINAKMIQIRTKVVQIMADKRGEGFVDTAVKILISVVIGALLLAGLYEIMAGASVSDIRLKETLEVDGTTNEYPYNPAELPYYYTGLAQNICDREFETLLGHPIPCGKWSGDLGLNDAICQMYYAKSGLARFVYRHLTARKKKSEDAGKPDLNILFIYNMPFRALAKMTGGVVSMEMAEGILYVVNGHFLKGSGKVIGGFFRNRKANQDYEKRLAKGRN